MRKCAAATKTTVLTVISCLFYRVAVPPQVKWAQTKEGLLITVNVECKEPEYKFTDQSMFFKGVGMPEKKQHEVTLNFLHKINPDAVVVNNNVRSMEFKIPKVEAGSYWPSLTTDTKKLHFLKVDFNRYEKDGSDSEEEANNFQMPWMPENFDMKGGSTDLGLDDEEDEDDEDADGMPPLCPQ